MKLRILRIVVSCLLIVGTLIAWHTFGIDSTLAGVLGVLGVLALLGSLN